MTVKLRSACALLVVVGSCGAEEDTDSTQGNLTFPAPGESRTIGFEVDAANQTIARGTYITEQYATAGIHFNGAFAVGYRPQDFPSFKRQPLSNNMICTWVAWQDTGLCLPPVGIMAAQMVVTLDFPACAVTIEGRTRGDGQQDGDILTVSAYNANGGLIQTINEYVNTGPNPPMESIVLGTVTGDGIRRVVIEDGELDALDNLIIERCAAPPPPPPVCGDGTLNEGEECDDGNTANGDGCSSTCDVEPPPPVCGDGNVDPNEECDDGNTANGDGCSSTCITEPPPAPVCGDGNVDPGEECDDGNTNYNDGCSGTCRIEQLCCCGNGSLEPGEQCDDGNHDDGDGCSSLCRLEPTCPSS